MSDTVSNAASDTSLDSIPDDLQELWKEAIEECERVERLHVDILHRTAQLQESLSEEDGIMVTYQGIHQDLMDVLDSIHAVVLEDPNTNVGSLLLDMLDSCEFKKCVTL
jgi:hypothetical protein